MSYTFHFLGLTHLPVSERFPGCAFTQKVWKLSKMLTEAGHTVYVYGVEGGDPVCTEYVKVLDLNDIRDEYGVGDNRFELGYDHTSSFFKHNFDPPYNKASQKFFKNAIKEINKRKADDHFLLCSMGANNKPIADEVNLYLTVEPGVGYRGSYANFKAFESSFIQNYTYGWKYDGKSANGNNYDVVIPNYFDPNDFEFKKEKQDYFLYIGRMIRRKGILIAIETCRAIGAKLILAGQGGRQEGNTVYGEDFSATYDNMEYVGFADKKKRSDLMSNAKATWLATEYLEPFGGTSIESLFCGTPVIVSNYGVFPETIAHGVVGYRCQTLDQFVWAAKNIDRIKPETCREYAVKNFSMEHVNEMFAEWFDMLYYLYESSRDPSKKGWSRITERKDLNWLNRYV
jgi:glycosyltransferase involved in cell wall biosynthesis